MATISTQGVFRNGRIELDRPIGVPDGTRVSLTIEPQSLTREERARRIRALAGSCADDPTFAESVDRAVRERRLYLPREIDLDAAP